MIKKIKCRGRTLYVCELCGAAYETKELAQQCEQWCDEHQSCNLEILEHAIFLEK